MLVCVCWLVHVMIDYLFADQIVEEIHKILADDWMDNEFSVLATEEDTIIARFKLDTIDSEKGLVAYMNVMSRDHRE